MPQSKRFTNQQIIEAYKATGSVWRAAKLLGACGQSIWERLKVLGYQMPGESWSEAEVSELKDLAPTCTLAEIGRRLGRSYAGVACKISELGIGTRFGDRGSRKVKRGSGLTKNVVKAHIRALNIFGGTIHQFCIQRGMDLEIFVQAIQSHDPEFWKSYVASHSDLSPMDCPQCHRSFIPMTKKQKTCSRKCSSRLRADRQYFGGKRMNTIGLSEGICQLCEKEKALLSSHHVFGKENDPENDYLVALCNGCHQLVTKIGVRAEASAASFWENLISLSIIRKMGANRPIGFHVCVDIEEIDCEDIAPGGYLCPDERTVLEHA